MVKLDELIAESIFKWKWKDVPPECSIIDIPVTNNKVLVNCSENASDEDIIFAMCCELPKYSSNIEHSFYIIEQLNTLGFQLIKSTKKEGYRATFIKVGFDPKSKELEKTTYTGKSKNPCIAICLAALKTKNIDVSEYER